MKHLLAVVVSVVSVVSLLGACNKPSPEDCEKAVRNIARLSNTENSLATADLQGQIRNCQGGSSREYVACAIQAKTPDDLKACNKHKSGQ